MILYLPSWRTVAEHAAADLASRGLWLCACSLCVEARAETASALSKGFCNHCGNVRRGRADSVYCCARCRIAAWRRRKASRGSSVEIQATLQFPGQIPSEGGGDGRTG